MVVRFYVVLNSSFVLVLLALGVLHQSRDFLQILAPKCETLNHSQHWQL